MSLKFNIKDISVEVEGDYITPTLVVKFDDDKIDNLEIEGNLTDFIDLANNIERKTGDVVDLKGEN